MNLVRILKAERIVATCNELLSVYFPGAARLPQCGKAPEKMVAYCQRVINADDSRRKSFREYFSAFMHNIRSFRGFKYKTRLVKSLFFASDLASVRFIPCSSVVYYLISPFWKIWRGFR